MRGLSTRITPHRSAAVRRCFEPFELTTALLARVVFRKWREEAWRASALIAGDVAATLVTLSSKLPAAAGVFGETAGSVISAATGMGVVVVATGVLPAVSPEH